MHIKNNTLFFILIFLYSILYLISGVGDSYISGDEMFFLSDRATDQFKYIFWKTYVGIFKAYDARFFFVFNNILLLYVLFKLKRVGLINHQAILLIFILPSYLYFSNTYLRDYFFFILSFAFIYSVYTKSLTGILISIVCSLVRPEFTVFYLLSYALYKRNFKYITPLAITIVIVFSLVVLISDKVYAGYIMYFVLGHLRQKTDLGMLSLDIYNLTQSGAALNALLSPLYFWFIPPSGTGGIFDILLYFETAVIIYLFYRLYSRRNQALQVLLLSMIAMSFFMAVVTVDHADNLRFRLMFLPFLLAGLVRK